MQHGVDPNSSAFLIGALVGACLVGCLCGALPLSVGLAMKRYGLAIGGFITCLVGGLILGVLLAGPAAIVFTIIIASLGKPVSRRRSRRRYYDDEDDDDEDRPRRRRRDEEDEEDDRPRRRRYED